MWSAQDAEGNLPWGFNWIVTTDRVKQHISFEQVQIDTSSAVFFLPVAASGSGLLTIIQMVQEQNIWSEESFIFSQAFFFHAESTFLRLEYHYRGLIPMHI